MSAPEGPLLDARGLTGGYGGMDILNGVDIAVDSSEIVVIVGPNGAGKSTAMKAIVGLVTLKSGRITYAGQEITGEAPEHLAGRGIAYVPQERNVFRTLSVEENLAMGGYARRGNPAPVIARIYELFPALKDRRRHQAGQLSGGQRQMVAIGRALMIEPRLLLLDEPTVGLSPKVIGEIFDRIQAINAGGVGILMVEQNARAALAIAHRGYVLATGRNRFADTASALLANRDMAEAFLGGAGAEAGRMPDWGTVLDFIGLYLIPGLVTGSIYALGAIGVSLLFGILRFADFAHGDLMTLGAYLALTIVTVFGWPVLAAIPVAAAGAALVALGLDRAFYRPFRKRPTIISVIASFGVMLMIRSAVQLIWGVEPLEYRSGIEQPLVFFDQLRIQERHIWIVGSTIVLMIALHLLLTRTRIGRAMRAVSDEPDLARVSGISTERVIQVTWLIGGALAAIAGIFIGMDSQIESYMGWNTLLPVFAAAILGGIGQPMGAAFGGLVLGLIEELSTYPWIGDDPLISPDYKTGLAFAIMVALLIWRPTGLLRGRQF